MHNQITRRLTAAAAAGTCLLICGVVGLAVSPTSALAATTVNLYVAPGGVTSGSYPGVCTQATPCSLELALIQVNSGTALKSDAVVINLATGTYPDGGYTIEPNSVASPASVELLGEGSGPSQTVLTGGETVRTLTVGGVSYAVTIQNLELENGDSGLGYGGNLLVEAAAGAHTTVLDDAIVTGGFSASGGQADVTSGGLTIENTTVENGGYETYGSATVGSDLSVRDSTYSGNDEDGIYVGASGNLSVYSSTIVGNADYGVESLSGFSQNVVNSTIAGNGFGGVKATSGSVYIGDSILDANDGHDCAGGTKVVDDYSNVADDSTCGFNSVDGSKVVTSAQIGLQPLANNGGPTETERITASSAAHDFVPLDNNDQGADQRGIAYLQPGQTMTDAGAYQYAPPTVSSVSPASAASGASVQLTGNNLLYATAAFGSGNVSGTVTNPSLTSLGLTVPTLAPGSQVITVTNADGSVTVPFTVPAPATSGSTTTSTTSTTPTSTPASSGSTTLLAATVLVPFIKVRSSSLKFKRGKAPVKLTCSTATCSGAITITGTKLVKLKHGHRTEDVVLARGVYHLAAGATASVTLSLTGAGKKLPRLAHAVRETITASLIGGKTLTTKVSLS